MNEGEGQKELERCSSSQIKTTVNVIWLHVD